MGIRILKIVFGLLLWIISNLISNVYVNSFSFNLFSYSIIFLIFILAFNYLFRNNLKRNFDLAVLHIPILLTTAGFVLAQGWNSFPEMIPFGIIFCSVLIFLLYGEKKKHIGFIIPFIALLMGIFFIKPFYYNKFLELEVNSDYSREINSEISFLDIDSSQVQFNPKDYKVSLIDFSGKGCVTCIYKEAVLLRLIDKYKYRKEVHISRVLYDYTFDEIRTRYDSNKINNLNILVGKSHEQLKKLGINSYPTGVMFNSKGEIISKITGYSEEFENETFNTLVNLIEKQL